MSETIGQDDEGRVMGNLKIRVAVVTHSKEFLNEDPNPIHLVELELSLDDWKTKTSIIVNEFDGFSIPIETQYKLRIEQIEQQKPSEEG